MKTCKRCDTQSNDVQTYELTLWDDDNNIHSSEMVLCPKCLDELWEVFKPYESWRRIM